MLYTKVLRWIAACTRERRKRPEKGKKGRKERKRGGGWKGGREEVEPFASVGACSKLSIYYASRVVCVEKGEKKGHILYLWVFAATVLSRRRLVAQS